MPLRERFGSVDFENWAAVEVSVSVEMIVERGMHYGELLKVAHPPDLSLSSPEWQVAVFCTIVEMPTRFLALLVADFTHGSAV